MTKLTRTASAALNARTALTVGRGTWRMRSGRFPWQSRRTLRHRARTRARALRRLTLLGR